MQRHTASMRAIRPVRTTSALAGLFLLVSGANAADYHVDRAHPQANDANPGTAVSPWKTIGKAAATLVAGDTALIKAGTYAERVEPRNSGTAEKRIVYRNNATDAVLVTGGFSLSGSYVEIHGFECPGSPIDVDGSHNLVEKNYVHHTRETYGGISLSGSDNVARNNRVANCGAVWGDNTIISGSRNLFEYNKVSDEEGMGEDLMKFFGTDHVIQYNHFHATKENGRHNDAFQSGDCDRILFKGNVVTGVAGQLAMLSGWGGGVVKNITFQDNLMVMADGGGYGFNGNAEGLVLIGNTLCYGGYGMMTGFPNAVVKNNIFYYPSTASNNANSISYPDDADADYNLIYPDPTGKWGCPTKRAHDIWGKDPKFVNAGAHDFHLAAGSPAIDVGLQGAAGGVDADGKPRGVNGAWDIGAYEYGAAATPIAPAITTQPVNRTANVGQTATFTAVATGIPAPTYQWQKNNVAIAGATAASYTTPATTLADHGATFRLLASNSLGTVMSSPVTLTVAALVAPTITTQPASLSVSSGQTATFAVVATGTAPLSYQWKKGTTNVGTNSATLTIANVQATNAGSYTCTVTNAVTGVTSTAATLTVATANQPPVVSAATATPSPVTGTKASLSATATDDGGATALIYTWSATGPAAVAFSPNGSNAAKASTATFGKAGSYTLTVTAKDAANLTGTKTVTVIVNATPTLSISPTGASVQPGMTVDFNAVVRDQFNLALATQPTVTWTVSGGGTVNANGLFTAGAGTPSPTGGISATTYVVTATAGSASSTALVTVSTASTDLANGGSGGKRCGGGSALALIAGLGLMLVRRRRR